MKVSPMRLLGGVALLTWAARPLAAAPPPPAPVPPVAPASPTVNAAAEERLRGLFLTRNEGDAQHLFSGASLICGPYLWKQMSASPELADKGADFRFFANRGANGAITGGAGGRMFNTRDSIAVFRRVFLDRYRADPKAKIRKLRPAELRLFASMLPFGLSEPMFAVETGGHTLVVRMNDKLRIAWIDDFQHLR